jgi:ADP-ribosylglycohydrolase
MRDRIRGALIGLAVGDAVGTTAEFNPPSTFAPVTDMVGGGPFRLRAGEWTDDTSMALCLAESLIECGGFDARDQMERYVKWWKTGHLSSTGHCFDIGNTTRAALARFVETGDPLSGSTSPNAAGNGSLMRLAPAAMFYVSQPEEGITSHHRVCFVTAGVLAWPHGIASLVIRSSHCPPSASEKKRDSNASLSHGSSLPVTNSEGNEDWIRR